MRKAIVGIVLTAACICTLAVITASVRAVEPEPLKVGEDQTYHTLNDAIAFAQEGQVIQIVGSVTETNPANPVVIGKRITIQGNGSSAYKITGWTRPDSPFQVTAEGVVIRDLDIAINGGSTAYPLIKTGRNLSLNNVSITLDGTLATASAPILVGADGLKMEDVDISSTTRTTEIVDLQGNSAEFKGVSITAGAKVTGIYSESSPTDLVLENCEFYTTATTSIAVSLPSPAGLTLRGCDFAFTGAGAGLGNVGLLFTTPSGAVANQTLTASDCTFDMKSGTGIGLNGYSASLSGCEFVFDANSGKGISSETPGNAHLTLIECKFYLGKTAGAKITGANCVVLKESAGDVIIDRCTVVASDPSTGLTTQKATVISAPDSKLNSLTISGSDLAFNAGANGSIGVDAKSIGSLTITGSNFIVDAPSVVCVKTENIGTGRIGNSNFAVGTASAAANGVTCINASEVESLTIEDRSSFTVNTKSTGVSAGVKRLTVEDSGFYIDAASANGIAVHSVEVGSIRSCNFYIEKVNAVGLGILNSGDIHFTGNTFDLSTGGKGINMTNSSGIAAGDVVMENSAINIKGDATIVGFLFEHLGSLKIKNAKLVTPGGTTGSTVCVRGNHIKDFEIDSVEMDFNSTTSYGFVINELKHLIGDEVKVRITNATANLSAPSTRAIRIFYADGVLVDNYRGNIQAGSTSSYLLSLQNSKNVEVRNCDYQAEAAGASFLSFASDNTTSEESRGFKIHNNNLMLKNKAQGIIATKANHDVEIYENAFNISNATKGVVIAYGRNNSVYKNQFWADNCDMAITSDGVDEIASFSPDVDSDIYDVNGNIVDSYRNKIHNNIFTGSYERGLYISNNGELVIDNDFSGATFHYESTPGKIVNAQIDVKYCKDVKILNNKFAKARSADNQVIRADNAVLSEVTGNTTQLVGGASEVLFVQGLDTLAPNGTKYPESITVHNATNTINGLTPVEIVREWGNPDNLIYEYILKLSEPLPPTPAKPEPSSPPPGIPGTTLPPDWSNIYDGGYVEITENEVPLSPVPEINPNPDTGKGKTLSLYIGGISMFITAGLLFWAGNKRRLAK